MIKHCQTCQESFEAARRNPHQKFCSDNCRKKAAYERKKLKTWFAREWRAWLRDFALGKTQSNLRRDD